MRFTSVLCSMHIGNQFKRIWEPQKVRKVLDFGVKQLLESKGIPVISAMDAIGLKKEGPHQISLDDFAFPKIPDGDVDPSLVKKIDFKKRDSTHPNWHDEPIRIFHQHSSFFYGLDEGLNLTKTNLVDTCLPNKILSFKKEMGDEFHNKVQRAILNACVLDSQQKKLPKNAFKVRGYGFSGRVDYGLSKTRRNDQLLTKIFQIFDSTLVNEGVDVSQILLNHNKTVKAPLTVDESKLMFDLKIGRLVLNRKKLQPYADEAIRADVLARPLPSIYPLSRLLSCFPSNIYQMEHQFLVSQNGCPTTNDDDVSSVAALRPECRAPYDNLTMAVVTLNNPFNKQNTLQLQAHLLAHSFGVAAASAQRLYGVDVTELPEPLTLNCVHSDSQNFIFGALQVHSLDLNGEGDQARNLLWLEEPCSLYSKCEYVDGQPVLEGYNPHCAETLIALYRSQLAA